MKQLSSEEIRVMFLDYFKRHGHHIEKGASLIPHNDDTLLWINSGVAALKKYFDGSSKAPNPRIANIQKSIRTNDIENVGKTARHHTFFEMMGNFSIGDYFKEEAIGFAFEFLFSPKYMGFNLNTAYVSVHPDDQEAYEIWTKKFNFPKERILKTEDNFWQIGNGPCGPNSEIFIDRGEAYDPDKIGEKLFFEDIENDRYVEVWNIVFSQFDGVEGEDIHSFKELPQKNIDTGMGFERLVSLVQNAESNFDTDLFEPILDSISRKTTLKYEENKMAYRVIADHIRTLVFAISDGATFSNEGRGYVLRRLLRRAARFGRELEIEGPFMADLVDSVVIKMSPVYPYLEERSNLVKKLVHQEEIRFLKTLDEGERLLQEAIQTSETRKFDGKLAFKLYDTYGFPVELTEEILEEHGMSLKMEDFMNEMEAQRNRAREARGDLTSMKSQNEALLNFKEGSIFDRVSETKETQIIGLVQEDKMPTTTHGKMQIILKETIFYAESGGQVADRGFILVNDRQYEVIDVQKAPNGQHMHLVEINEAVEVGDRVKLLLDSEHRLFVRKNHSAVHLLHSALRLHLGKHVEQAGSYVSSNYLRFDFSHFEALTEMEKNLIELQVNEWIYQALPITIEEMSLNDAKDTGALALFSENYGHQVRVVSMGDVSKELCGGMHASNTSEIGLFRIINEESVGSGVRRITAQCSKAFYEYYRDLDKQLKKIRQDFKIPVQKSLDDKLLEMKEEIESLKEENRQLLQKQISLESQNLVSTAKINKENLKIMVHVVRNMEQHAMKALVDQLLHSIDAILLVNEKETGANLMVALSKLSLEQGYNAGDLSRETAQILGGNGGGRANFAQAGAKSLEKIDDAKLKFYEKFGLNL